jgi:hypothetical protein
MPRPTTHDTPLPALAPTSATGKRIMRAASSEIVMRVEAEQIEMVLH